MDVGVEVPRSFEPSGNVRCVEAPAREVAWTLHVGPCDRLKEARDAVHAWCAAHNRKIGAASWETYGDGTDDRAQNDTTISYLLA